MKAFLLPIVSVLSILLLASCSGVSTVTVTAPPVTNRLTTVIQASPLTFTASITQAFTTTITQALPPPVIATIVVTKTLTPTLTASIYQGSMNGIFSGTTTDGTSEIGTFMFIIDANGDVKGSFEATLAGVKYAGSINGEVDLIGNLIAMGAVSGSPFYSGATWNAHISLSGNAMSVQGTWTEEYASGIFSGNGNLSR